MIHGEEYIDYLAELVASHLLARDDKEKSKAVVHYQGLFKRFFSEDIDALVPMGNTGDIKDWHLYLNREGLYDLLPEGLFHKHRATKYKDTKDTIEEFKARRKEENHSRHFFKPLEQEFFSYWLNKEIFEQSFFYAPDTIDEFIEFFKLDTLRLNQYQKAALFFMLPYLSKIAGNIELTRTCFEIILLEAVVIKITHQNKATQVVSDLPALQGSKLGKNTLLGSICVDQNPMLTIEIGPLKNSSSLLSYIEGSERQLVNRLCDFFIQANVSTNILIKLNEKDQKFVLGSEVYQGRIKYSTTI